MFGLIYLSCLVVLFVFIKPVDSIKKFNQVVIVNSTNFVVVQLKPQLEYQYIVQAKNGQVYQTSWVFSHYNYAPAKGLEIKLNEYLSDIKSRFVYKPKRYDSKSQLDLLGWVNRDTTSIGKVQVLVHVLPESKYIISSNFLLGDESWTISGSNPLKPPKVIYQNYNGGFITGTENYINVFSYLGPDKAIWYFKAPDYYYRDLSIGFGGTLEFKLVWLAGDLAGLHVNSQTIPLVKLGCSRLTVNYYNTEFNKFKKKWIIRLVPEEFVPRVSPEEFINLLEQINSIEILGDWTKGYETIGLKWIRIKHQ